MFQKGGMLERLKDLYVEKFTVHLDDFFVDIVDEYNLRNRVPFVAVSAYLFVVFILPYLLPPRGKSKLPKSLKFLSFCWNLSLSLFSFVCLLCIGGHHYFLAKEHGVMKIFCDDHCKYLSETKGPTHFWYIAFLLSKYAELGDTFLLIIKRPERRPSFLHVYHHISVMLTCWYLAVTHIPVSHYGVTVNLFVHSVMYLYYALYDMGYPQKWGKLLTIIQMVQMVGGIWATGYYLYQKKYHPERECCGRKYVKEVLICLVIMYTTYLFLFARFFYNKYYGSKKGTKKQSTTEKVKKMD